MLLLFHVRHGHSQLREVIPAQSPVLLVAGNRLGLQGRIRRVGHAVGMTEKASKGTYGSASDAAGTSSVCPPAPFAFTGLRVAPCRDVGLELRDIGERKPLTA